MLEVVRETYLNPDEISSWRPTLPNHSGTTGEFTMADLVSFGT